MFEFKGGAPAYTIDGDTGGKVRRVVVSPQAYKVTHIVVEKGLIARDDRVVSTGKIASATSDKVLLSCTKEELDEMSPLEMEEFEPASETQGLGQSYDPIRGVSINPALDASGYSRWVRTIPEELVALKEGATVSGMDEKHVGNLESVLCDEVTGEIRRLVVSQGLLIKGHRNIPVEWIDWFNEEEIRLSVGHEKFEEVTMNRD